jgi:hypothetical protein
MGKYVHAILIDVPCFCYIMFLIYMYVQNIMSNVSLNASCPTSLSGLHVSYVVLCSMLVSSINKVYSILSFYYRRRTKAQTFYVELAFSSKASSSIPCMMQGRECGALSIHETGKTCFNESKLWMSFRNRRHCE